MESIVGAVAKNPLGPKWSAGRGAWGADPPPAHPEERRVGNRWLESETTNQKLPENSSRKPGILESETAGDESETSLKPRVGNQLTPNQKLLETNRKPASSLESETSFARFANCLSRIGTPYLFRE